MDSASDEITLLPLVFGLTVFVIIAIGVVIHWLLSRFRIYDKYYLVGVLKDAIFSILGTLIFFAMVGSVVLILKGAISFFRYNFLSSL
jgi:hypothetical protein